MAILALDTSGPVCSVAIMENDVLCYEARAINKLTHSRSLMPMVDEAFHKAGKSLNQVRTIAAVVGPGSFTGVRIGVATAQGIARGLDIPCISVNALDAMAENFPFSNAVICPIRDARVQQVYGAAFCNGKRLIEDQALKVRIFLALVAPLGDEFVFMGDGVRVCKEMILETMGEKACFAPPHLLQPGAAVAASWANRHLSQAKDPGELMPLYLRAPQAERMKNQQKNGL